MPIQKVDKRTIIKESLHVFRNKGYQSTTMTDIAVAAGLLKGSLYHHFGSKEELMKEVILYLHDWYNRNVFSIAYDETLTGREKLDRLTELSEQVFYHEPGGCLMANIGLETADTKPEFTYLIRDYLEDWIKALAHIFEERFQKEEARQMAEMSVAEIEGSVLLMQIYQDQGYLDRVHRHIKQRYEQRPVSAIQERTKA